MAKKTFYLFKLNGNAAAILHTGTSLERLVKATQNLYRRCTVEMVPLPNMTEDKKASLNARFIGPNPLPTVEEVLSA